LRKVLRRDLEPQATSKPVEWPSDLSRNSAIAHGRLVLLCGYNRCPYNWAVSTSGRRSMIPKAMS
jgi:hypothetical protein